MSLIAQTRLTVENTGQPSSHNGLFDEGSHSLLFARLKQDTQPEPSFGLLAETLLENTTDWQQPAAELTTELLARLKGGQDLYIAVAGLVRRSAYRSTAFDNLLSQYRLHNLSMPHEMEIPGENVTWLQGRSYVDTFKGSKRRAVVDVQIKTDADKPVYIFGHDEQTKSRSMQPVETGGRWFTFPLDRLQVVKLDLIS